MAAQCFGCETRHSRLYPRTWSHQFCVWCLRRARPFTRRARTHDHYINTKIREVQREGRNDQG